MNEHKVAIPLEFLYKKSYTLVSLIIHDGDYLDCGHYVSDFFDTNKGIWWHSDDDNITQISDVPERVYIRDIHKKVM